MISVRTRPASADRTARRHVFTMRVAPFAFRYQENGATPCQYIDTTRKANWLHYNLPLTVFISWNFAADFSCFIVEIARKTTNLGIWSPFWVSYRGGVEPWLMARWKACVDFLLTVIELLFLSLTVDALQGKTCQNSLLWEVVGQFEPRFQGGERVVPREYFFGFCLQNFTKIWRLSKVTSSERLRTLKRIFWNLYKYQPSLTKPRVALHHGKRAAKRWTLSDNLATNEVDNAYDTRRFELIVSYLSKVANFNLPHLHLAHPLRCDLLEFCRDLRQYKTRVPKLSCGVIVCVILRLAVSVEHRLVTETRLWHIAR